MSARSNKDGGGGGTAPVLLAKPFKPGHDCIKRGKGRGEELSVGQCVELNFLKFRKSNPAVVIIKCSAAWVTLSGKSASNTAYHRVDWQLRLRGIDIRAY